MVVAGGYVLLVEVLPGLAAAALAVTLGIVITGALHEDGLADTVDAFGAGGGPEETLRILKDPTHGTYGVIALVLSIVLRVLALAALPGDHRFVGFARCARAGPRWSGGLDRIHASSDWRRAGRGSFSIRLLV